MIKNYRFIIFVFALVLTFTVTACAGMPGAKTNPTPTTISKPVASSTLDDTSLELAARQIVEAIATVDYKTPAAWKAKLLALSNADGQKFWQLNADNLLKDVVTHQRATEQVTLEHVTLLEKQSTADSQGKTITATAVLVTGHVIYADDAGRHDDPINQPLLLANLDGTWKFVSLISPSALNALTQPNPVPK